LYRGGRNTSFKLVQQVGSSADGSSICWNAVHRENIGITSASDISNNGDAIISPVGLFGVDIVGYHDQFGLKAGNGSSQTAGAIEICQKLNTSIVIDQKTGSDVGSKVGACI
jgi:hypothetical protein